LTAGHILSRVFGKRHTSEADATVVAVKMTERRSYGEAKVRVTYTVDAPGRAPFEAVREATVKMRFLPQVGQRVRVRFNDERNELREVVTPPGDEGVPPAGSPATEEIPWIDSGRANWWANGTRRR
jgi:hypothetical protein